MSATRVLPLAGLLACVAAAGASAEDAPGEDHVAVVRALVAAVEAGEQQSFEACSPSACGACSPMSSGRD